MNKAKYLLAFFLFSLAFLFVGEMFIGFLDNFGTQFYETTMYPQKGIFSQIMLDDIREAAKENKVEIFVIEHCFSSDLQEELIFYGTDGVKDKLKKDYFIDEQQYRSVFWGNVEVRYKPLSDLDVKLYHTYKIIGEFEDARNFKLALIDRYAGNHVKDLVYSIDENDVLLIFWGVVIGILLFVTAYHVLLWRKEVVVRVTLGEKMTYMVLKGMGSDLFIMSLLFWGSQYIVSFFCNSYYNLSFTFVMYSTLMGFTALIYLSLFSYDYRKALIQHLALTRLLKTGYCFKIVSFLMVIVVVSAEVLLIYSAMEYSSQQNFFEKYREYSYVNLSFDLENEAFTDEDYQKVSRDFYYMFPKIVLEDVSFYNDSQQSFLFANESALE